PPPPIRTLSLHDALPISFRPHPMDYLRGHPAEDADGTGCSIDGRDGPGCEGGAGPCGPPPTRLVPFWPVSTSCRRWRVGGGPQGDRKSTRLNSSHVSISY